MEFPWSGTTIRPTRRSGLGFGAAKDYKAEAVENLIKLSISPSATLLLGGPLGVTGEQSACKT